ncbi:hypothetical protein M501DRAFT_1015678 [Patellaria atrata CBS 101060]|uniref:DUF2470 domain-containing protein n=1 Tax=Patellaria atrata CBS 101060 TaxID=1346257 RepID=A0A9P4SDF5_9PEZI|nr:hypothetical protein M501DRAFT_1015678 [Patellaria atrata CBS 101060]
MGDTKDAAAKQRIISHMNADHQDSVMRYVEHYHNLSSFSARNAKLIDISLNEMRIDVDGKKYSISFEPTLESFRDARERVIAMDLEATASLKRSDITLKEYLRPQGRHSIILVLCLIGYAALFSRRNWQPGSYQYDYIWRHTPFLIPTLVKYQPLGLSLMVGLHTIETVYMWSRLSKHSVPTFSRVWWMWTVSTFCEGFGAHERVSSYVSRKREQKAKQKH